VLIGIDPVILAIGPLAVRWFGLCALLGLGLATYLSMRAIERQRLGPALALDALAWGLPVGLLSARLVHVLGNWDYYLIHTSELWQLNPDGLSLWGGLLGGAAVAAARLGRDPTRRRRILDASVPNVLLGIALGRLGAFLDGHGQGAPSDLPWATLYTQPLAATPDFGVPRHPAQLYDVLLCLMLCVVLRALPRQPAGTRLAAFLALYGTGRVMLGLVRLDAAFLFGLQIEQLLALGAIAVGVWLVAGPRLGRQVGVAATTSAQAAATSSPRAKEDSMAA
jgi:phosphatidylglycerol:prolipoprotein diacylglycerol transferase